MITLTLRSFSSVKPDNPDSFIYSVARWQPRGYHFQSIRELMPFDDTGIPIQHLTPQEYLPVYLERLTQKLHILNLYIKRAMSYGVDMTFLCWCNPKRQSEYPSLMCHTILIGYAVEAIYAEQVKVEYLDGRDNPVWTREQFREAWRQK